MMAGATALIAQAQFTLSGKTAIITGAGSGINFCFARSLLEAGCNVVIGDLSLRPEAEALVGKYSSGQSSQAIFVKTDVTRWDDLEALFRAADSHFGGADIVCPGAGVFEPHWSNFWHPPGGASGEARDPIHGSATEGIGHYACLDINLTHPIRCSQMAIARWLDPPSVNGKKAEKVSLTNPKRIVHISSIAAQVPGFAHPLYTASKHALSGFIRSLGPLDAKLGIRVNGVAPGIIKTPLWLEHPEKLAMLDQSRDMWVEPEEVADAMVRCLVDDEMVGGSVLEVKMGATRLVGWKMDPGPEGDGAMVSRREVVGQQVFDWLDLEGWGGKTG